MVNNFYTSIISIYYIIVYVVVVILDTLDGTRMGYDRNVQKGLLYSYS